MLPDSSYTVYTTANNLTINSSWDVLAGEKYIIIVDGALEIQRPITVDDGGFLAFVVKNDIQINSDVGTTWDSSTPVVEGMYIAGGAIKTGYTTAEATARFVGKGMFAANEIITQRSLHDIQAVNHNSDTSADLFLYNPAFLVTMPDILKDLSYTWQEVAP